MKNRCALLTMLIASLVSNIIHAQHFMPGYIVDQKGDTIKGQIDDRFWDTSPSSVDFKNDQGISAFSANSIRGFGIDDGAIYRGYNIEYDTTGGSTEMTTNSQPTLAQASTFLRVVVNGKYSLLRFKHKSRVHFYSQVDSQKPFELISHYYYSGPNSKVGGKQYIGQLIALAAGCSGEIVSSSLPYSSQALSKVMVAINKCHSSSARIFLEERSKTTAGVLIHGGVDRLRKGFDFGGGFGFGVVILMNHPHLLFKNSWGNEISIRKFPDQSVDREDYSYFISQTHLKYTTYWQSRIKDSKTHFLMGATAFKGFGNGNVMKINGSTEATQLRMSAGLVMGIGYKPTPKMNIDVRIERGSGPSFKDSEFSTTASGYGSIMIMTRFIL